MGGGAGSGNLSQSTSRSGTETLNPASLIFGQALGLPGNIGTGGGLTFGGVHNGSLTGGSMFNLANPSFTPGSFDALGSIAQPLNPYQLDIPGAANFFGNQAMDLYGNSILPAAKELADTGFKTDIQPAVDYSKYLFQNDFLPAAAEQYGGMGLGPGDSDFSAAIAREAGRRSNELGALDVNLQEAASGRRAAGLPLAAQLPTGLADSLFGLEQSSRQAQRAASPGGQLFDLLMSISGMNTQGQSASESRSKSYGFGMSGYGA